MPKPAKPSTDSLPQQLAAEMPAIQAALIDQAKSGNVAAIKLCYDLNSSRDVAAELLLRLLAPHLQP